MPSMLTTTLVGAASAVAGALAKQIWTAAAVAVTALRDRLQADHRPLYDGEWRLSALHGATGDRFEIRLHCAPNRSLGLTEINPDIAIRFAHEAFPDHFMPQPEYSSSRSGVQMRSADGLGYLWVWKSGRVDLSWHLPPSADRGSPTLDAVELLRPVALLAAAVDHARYVEMFGRRFRGRHRKFDWYIVVTPSIRVDGEEKHWAFVRFPGATPPRAGTRQTPFCPPTGFAGEALRNWSPRRGIRRALRAFLADYLETNGHHDVNTAVDDAIAALGDHADLEGQPLVPRSVSTADADAPQQ